MSCGPSGGSSTSTVTIPVDAVTTSTRTLPGGGVITATPGVLGSGAGGSVVPGGGAGITGGVTPALLTTSAVFASKARREIGSLVDAIAVGFLALLV